MRLNFYRTTVGASQEVNEIEGLCTLTALLIHTQRISHYLRTRLAQSLKEELVNKGKGNYHKYPV